MKVGTTTVSPSASSRGSDASAGSLLGTACVPPGFGRRIVARSFRSESRHTCATWLGWASIMSALPADGKTVPARAQSYEILDDWGQAAPLELGEGNDAIEVCRVRRHEPDLGPWVEYRLANQYGVIERLEGDGGGRHGTEGDPASDDVDHRRVRTHPTEIAPTRIQFEMSFQLTARVREELWKDQLLKPDRVRR